AEQVATLRRLVGQGQRRQLGVTPAMSFDEQQAGERRADRGDHHQEDVAVLEQQTVVDRVVVAEPARGEEEPERDSNREWHVPPPCVHKAPPVSAWRPRVTATAVPKKTAVATKLAGDRAE